MNDISNSAIAEGAQPVSGAESRSVLLFKQIAAPYIIAPETGMTGSLRLVFDVEADGLLDAVTKAHCIVIANLDQDEINAYGPAEIGAALAHLQRADYLVSHNGIGYDLPLLRQLYGWAPSPTCKIVDTLTTGRLILPDVASFDDKVAAMTRQKSGEMRGSYSLEAWGTRLGVAKVGTDIEVWKEWSPEIQERCVGDVRLTKTLHHFLKPDGYDQRAIELEHRATFVCEEIKTAGMPFDETAGKLQQQQWKTYRSSLEKELRAQFPEVKNWNSLIQIGKLLLALSWEPEEFTKKTKRPKLTDEVFEELPKLFPKLTGIADHQVIGRRLGQLANGKQAWLRQVGPDKRIHGRIIHIGTPHSAPRIPAPTSDRCRIRKRESRSLRNAAHCFKRTTAGYLFLAIRPDCRTAPSRTTSPSSTAAPTPRRISPASIRIGRSSRHSDLCRRERSETKRTSYTAYYANTARRGAMLSFSAWEPKRPAS
jgi:hypothetical protein